MHECPQQVAPSPQLERWGAEEGLIAGADVVARCMLAAMLRGRLDRPAAAGAAGAAAVAAVADAARAACPLVCRPPEQRSIVDSGVLLGPC